MVNYTNVHGVLLMAPDKPCPIGTGNNPRTPFSMGSQHQDLIVVWSAPTEQDSEGWELEVYGRTPEQVTFLQQWALGKLRDTFPEGMGWDEEGEPIPWPEEEEAVVPGEAVRFAAVMFPVA